MDDRPLVTLVIVSWNGREMVRQCLQSIEKHLDYPHQVVVIDNNSSDKTADLVAEKFPSVHLMRNSTNRGFAAAVNQGLAQSTGEYLVILNPDTELTSEPFRQLIEQLQADPTIAAIGPEILHTDGSHQPSVRRFPGWFDQAITLLKLRHLLSRTWLMQRYLHDPHPQRAEVDQIMGAAMVIPRTMFQRLGVFDAGYWIWFEEVDWCRRARLAGYKVVYDPISSIIHHGGQSFQQVMSWRKQWWYVRSLYRYALKFWSPLATAALAPFIILSLFLTGAQMIIKPR